METLKKIYKKLILISVYTIIACTVYGYWFQYMWGKWYITLITILLIIGVGATIGYFYIKPDLDKKEVKEEPKLDTPQEVEHIDEEISE